MKRTETSPQSESEIVLLDISKSCSRPEQLQALIEEARDRITANPADDLTDLILETESLVVQDYPIVKGLASCLAEKYFSPYDIVNESCGVAGASYVTKKSMNTGRRAIVSGVKRPESIFSKAGKKMKGRQAIYQTNEARPATEGMANEEYSLGDVLRLRAVGESVYDVRMLIDCLLKDSELNVKEDGVEFINGGYTGHYFAYHIDLTRDGLNVELQVVPKTVHKRSKQDGYHKRTKYDMSGLQRTYESQGGLYIPTGLETLTNMR